MGCTTSNDLQILVLVGSIRKNSNNRGLVEALINAEEFKGLGIQVHTPDLSEIPFFNEDLEKEKRNILIQCIGIPPSVSNLKKLCKRANLLLFVTPEFNSSIAPALKNAYDWLSRPDPEYDNKAVVGGKCAAILSTSYIGQTQIHDCQKMGEYCKLRYYGKSYYVNLASGAFDQKGQLKSEAEKKKLLAWGADLVTWANQNK